MAEAKRLPDPAGQTTSALLAASEAAYAAKDLTARRQAMKQLAAAVKSDPAALAEVDARLRTPGVDGNELRTLVEALTLADSPAAWDAMKGLLTDVDAPELARHSVAVAAGFSASPPDALIDTLTALSAGRLDEVGTAALLGLGIQGNRERGGPHVERVRDALLARAEVTLEAAHPRTAPAVAPGVASPAPEAEPVRVSAWLDALGNLGGPDVWPLIQPYLHDDEEWIRHSAVGALYYIALPEARQALAERILNDPSPYVRRAAVRTAANHPQQVFEAAIIRALQEDDKAIVRLEAATALAAWGIDTPALYPIIARAAERENDPAARRMMTELQPEDLTDPADLVPVTPELRIGHDRASRIERAR